MQKELISRLAEKNFSRAENERTCTAALQGGSSVLSRRGGWPAGSTSGAHWAPLQGTLLH